jgi:hypothetical protein
VDVDVMTVQHWRAESEGECRVVCDDYPAISLLMDVSLPRDIHYLAYGEKLKLIENYVERDTAVGRHQAQDTVTVSIHDLKTTNTAENTEVTMRTTETSLLLLFFHPVCTPN